MKVFLTNNINKKIRNSKNYLKMKKILFVLTVFLMAGTAMNAQKKCTAAEMAKCKKEGIKCVKADNATTKVASFVVEADALAEASTDIKREECAKSGKVAYYEKSTCAKSGKVSWEEVSYCGKSKKFTKVASASMERESMTSEVSKTVDTKATVATDTKSKAKGCCASKAGAAKSCSKKAEKTQ